MQNLWQGTASDQEICQKLVPDMLQKRQENSERRGLSSEQSGLQSSNEHGISDAIPIWRHNLLRNALLDELVWHVTITQLLVRLKATHADAARLWWPVFQHAATSVADEEWTAPRTSNER